MQIHTPVKGFTGQVVGVVFADGVGHTDDPNRLAYFRRHGFEVSEPAAAAEVTFKPLDKMTKAEVVAYAAAIGVDLGDTKGQTKAELLSVIEAAPRALDAPVAPPAEGGEPGTGDADDTGSAEADK